MLQNYYFTPPQSPYFPCDPSYATPIQTVTLVPLPMPLRTSLELRACSPIYMYIDLAQHKARLLYCSPHTLEDKYARRLDKNSRVLTLVYSVFVLRGGRFIPQG
jgi:hypothetical protein